MRDLAAATSGSAAAPQAPARNRAPPPPPALHTFNSHRRARLGDRRVYRPARRRPLARIDEAPRADDLSSTRPILRSRSNISADTSRSVPVCNESHEIGNQVESGSPQYAEPRSDSSSERPASMTDLAPACEYYYEPGLVARPDKRGRARRTNLYLAFMY